MQTYCIWVGSSHLDVWEISGEGLYVVLRVGCGPFLRVTLSSSARASGGTSALQGSTRWDSMVRAHKEDVLLDLVSPADVEPHGGPLGVRQLLQALVQNLLDPWLENPSLHATRAAWYLVS